MEQHMALLFLVILINKSSCSSFKCIINNVFTWSGIISVVGILLYISGKASPTNKIHVQVTPAGGGGRNNAPQNISPAGRRTQQVQPQTVVPQPVTTLNLNSAISIIPAGANIQTGRQVYHTKKHFS